MVSTCTPTGGLAQVKGGWKSVAGTQSTFTSTAAVGNWMFVPAWAALVCPERTSYPLLITNSLAAGLSRASSQMVAPGTTFDGGPPILLHSVLGVSWGVRPAFRAMVAWASGLPCRRRVLPAARFPTLPLAG